MYDILLKNARIIDHNQDIRGDVALEGGYIVRVDPHISPLRAEEVYDLKGKILMPGIIDPHVHLSDPIEGKYGHKMLVLAGITTALDLGGETQTVLDSASRFGKGLNIATLNVIRPYKTVRSEDPKSDELERLLEDSLKSGALGYKMLGGHYPLSPQAIQRAIELANKRRAYVAFHAGSLESASNLLGMREAVKLTDKNALHLAHINSYCRGQIHDPISESQEAIELLKKNQNIISESYLSPYNGTSSHSIEGIPESHVTRKCLALKGYEISELGIERAIDEGYANLSVSYGGICQLVSGKEGVNYWKGKGKSGTISFAVNPAESRFLLACARDEKGNFVVDAFSSDGGEIPRNEILDRGLALVQFGALSMQEFAQKSSYNPSRMLGLLRKGAIAEGWDADLLVIDEENRKPVLSIAGGQIILAGGVALAQGSTLITTQWGVDHAKKSGLKPYLVDLEESWLYTPRV